MCPHVWAESPHFQSEDLDPAHVEFAAFRRSTGSVRARTPEFFLIRDHDELDLTPLPGRIVHRDIRREVLVLLIQRIAGKNRHIERRPTVHENAMRHTDLPHRDTSINAWRWRLVL